MNYADLKDKSDQDLLALLGEKREAARQGRFATPGAKAGNVKAAKNLRRDIARVMTAVSARRIAKQHNA